MIGSDGAVMMRARCPNALGGQVGADIGPFADDQAQGGGEAATAEAFLAGEVADGAVVARFEVDHALNIGCGHGVRSFRKRVYAGYSYCISEHLFQSRGRRGGI